jgi:PAS domain S-box-containing protein
MGRIVIRRLVRGLPPARGLLLPFGLLAWLMLAGCAMGSRSHADSDRTPRLGAAQEYLLPWVIVAWVGSLVALSLVLTSLCRRQKRARALAEEGVKHALKDTRLAYWAIDREGTLTFCEGQGLARFVPPQETLVGKSVCDLFPHVAAFAENHRRVLAGEEFSAVVEISPLAILEISYRPIRNAQGQIVGARGVVVDITQWKQAEKELRREHQFVENLIQAAPAIVMLLDPSGHILRCNPGLEKVTGYDQHELQDRDWLSTFVPEAEHAQIRAVTAKAIDSEEIVTSITTIVTKDDDQLQIEWNYRALRDAQGNVLGILAFGNDVTALHEARTRAVQAERLAAIGEMVTGLAHESGNALQRIQACLEMLALQVQDRPAALDLVYRIQIAEDHLHLLYEEVRQYAAPIVLRREPVHVSDVLQQAWEHLEPIRTGRIVEFDNHVPANYVCRVDRYAMERVFRNILENALAAAADPVHIAALWRDAALGEQPAMELRLRDNGPGLTSEQKRRIFEPFYTTKTQSTGLGMAIAKRLVEAHGGRIAVGDQVSGGAEIVVLLPKE